MLLSAIYLSVWKNDTMMMFFLVGGDYVQRRGRGKLAGPYDTQQVYIIYKQLLEKLNYGGEIILQTN